MRWREENYKNLAGYDALCVCGWLLLLPSIRSLVLLIYLIEVNSGSSPKAKQSLLPGRIDFLLLYIYLAHLYSPPLLLKWPSNFFVPDVASRFLFLSLSLRWESVCFCLHSTDMKLLASLSFDFSFTGTSSEVRWKKPHLDSFEMTLISAPFSSLRRWLSFLRCSSC